MILPASFFKKSTVDLARTLLGTYLVHESREGKTVGRIVETEAYLFKDDPACHAAKGKTERNAAMFGPPGVCYVYLIYGIHLCFNIVSGAEHEGEAVLLRALEPISGIKLMQKRRKTDSIKNLCNGPGKLVQAMGITRSHNNSPLGAGSALKLYSADSFPRATALSKAVTRTTRIGINVGAALPLRFYSTDSEFVSRR